MKKLGIIITLMPAKWYHRDIFEIVLFCWQRIAIEYLDKQNRLSRLKKHFASRISHVTLCINELPNKQYEFFNQTNPFAKISIWTEAIIDHQEFFYGDPGPELQKLPPEFILKVQELAHKKVNDKKNRMYDYTQLLSFIVNLPIWIIMDNWGKEKIKFFNIPGGHEGCSTAIASILRSVENPFAQTLFFPGYDISMIFPLLYYMSNDWEFSWYK